MTEAQVQKGHSCQRIQRKLHFLLHISHIWLCSQAGTRAYCALEMMCKYSLQQVLFTVHQARRNSCHLLPNYSVIFACRLALKKKIQGHQHIGFQALTKAPTLKNTQRGDICRRTEVNRQTGRALMTPSGCWSSRSTFSSSGMKQNNNQNGDWQWQAPPAALSLIVTSSGRKNTFKTRTPAHARKYTNTHTHTQGDVNDAT